MQIFEFDFVHFFEEVEQLRADSQYVDSFGKSVLETMKDCDHFTYTSVVTSFEEGTEEPDTFDPEESANTVLQEFVSELDEARYRVWVASVNDIPKL